MKPKAKPPIDSLLRKFSSDLDASQFPQQAKSRAPHGLERRVREFLEHPENRGRRRAKRQPMRRARKTMKHLTHAVRHACNHVDPSVRKNAKSLVRSTQHESFEVLEQRAGKFNGQLRKAGRRREEQRRRNGRSRRSVHGGWTLVEVNSVDQLRSEGRELGLCVAHSDDIGRDYHRQLRSGESEFWSVRRREKTRGLIRIDTEIRKVVESAGRGNGLLKLKRKVACKLLRELAATADDQDAFSRVGAFSSLLDSRPKDATPIEFDGCEYRLWLAPAKKQIAIQARRPAKFGDGRAGRRRWSLFERDDSAVHLHRARRGRRSLRRSPEWCEGCSHPGAMSVGEFVDLLLRCPEIAERIREAF